MAVTATSSLLINPPAHTHILLLYDDPDGLFAVITDYINIGLERGQLCVIATIHFRDEGYIEKVSSLINNYKENVEKGNLLLVDLASFYVSALTGDITPFEEAKTMFAEKARERKDRHVRFIGDGTGFLFKNRHFDECTMIEEWWQEKPFEGSYVCPYLKPSMEAFPHDIHAKRVAIATHDVVIDISKTLLKSEPYEHPQIIENEDKTGKSKIPKGGAE